MRREWRGTRQTSWRWVGCTSSCLLYGQSHPPQLVSGNSKVRAFFRNDVTIVCLYSASTVPFPLYNYSVPVGRVITVSFPIWATKQVFPATGLDISWSQNSEGRIRTVSNVTLENTLQLPEMILHEIGQNCEILIFK